jgi:hypothetical protein
MAGFFEATLEVPVASSLFELADPRDDVLRGTLTDAVFAASLDEVVAGTAPDTYGNATIFFGGTYPSARDQFATGI